jgi:uncharacterized membrane protein HdeD (DUF308 family)
MVLVFGLLTIGVGVLAIAWPGVTFRVLAIILGVYVILFGPWWMLAGLTDDAGHQWLFAIGGLLAVLAGIVVLAGPIPGSFAVDVVIGAYWLVLGLIQLTTSIFGPGVEHRGWNLVASILSIAAGSISLTWPAITAVAFAWIAGIWLIMIGAIEVGKSFEVRRAENAPTTVV